MGNEIPSTTPPRSHTRLLVFLSVSIIAVLISLAGYQFYQSRHAGDFQSASSDGDAKMCSGVKIIFFAGGTQGDPVPSIITNGAKQAQKDLGADVDYVYSGWLNDTMVAQFKDSIEKKPDAIAMMGHPGEEALKPFVDEAEREGIIVTFQNVDLPGLRQKYLDNGSGYAGGDLYKFGFELGKGLVKKYSLSKKDKAVVLLAVPVPEDKEATGRALMGKGDIDGLRQGGLTVYTEVIPDEVNKNPDSPEGDKFIEQVISKYPGLKVIAVDHGELTASMGPILQRLGKKPGEYIVGGYDISPKTVENIKNGYVGIVRDQQLYLEGYLPVLQACLTRKYKFAGLYIDTGVGLIDATNVDSITDLVKRQIR
jgi:simple sugar transport system substrate-binding protein